MKYCLHCKKEFSPKRKEQIYCSKSCAYKINSTKNRKKTGPRSNWTYSKKLNKDGYLIMYGGNHPYQSGRWMIAEHIMLMEMHIKRRIKKEECVHHKNGIKTDNRMENLQLMRINVHSSEHSKKISKTRKRHANGRFA